MTSQELKNSILQLAIQGKIEQDIINQALMRMRIFEPMHLPYFLTYFDFVLKKMQEVVARVQQ